eukprot:4595427-Alexandrium_andersonii.AAC.1
MEESLPPPLAEGSGDALAARGEPQPLAEGGASSLSGAASGSQPPPLAEGAAPGAEVLNFPGMTGEDDPATK